MGKFKEIKTSLEEIGIIDIILTILLIISLFYSLKVQVDNDKLLKQVDEKDAIINQINSEYENLNDAYEDLKNKYEYVVDFIRSTDRYQDAKEFEEDK